MKQTLTVMLAVGLVLAFSGVAGAAAFKEIWFSDDFESYNVETKLKDASPKWDDGAGPENKIMVWDGGQAVRLKGTSGSAEDSTAVTAGSFDDQSAGKLQTLSFTLQSDTSNQSDVGFHTYIYLWAAGDEIGRWYGQSNGMTPRVGGVVGSSSVDITDGNVHEFAITYDPVTGLTQWLHNGTEQWSHTGTTGLAADYILVEDKSRDGNDWIWMDDVVVGEVPEPATLSLLVLGSLGLLRRRKRRNYR